MAGTNNAGKVVDLTSNDLGVKKQIYNITDDYKTNNRVDGRYLNIRISSNNSDSWRLAGYSFDYITGGRNG